MYTRALSALSIVFVLSAPLALASVSMSQAVLSKFTEEEQKYQLPAGVMAKLARIESGGNTSARARTSSATGIFQWLTGSWRTTTTQLYGAPKHPDLRLNPFVSSEVTGYNLRQIQNQVWPIAQRAKADQQTALYMGHFLGMAGAGKFFNIMAQNPNASAAAYFPQQAAANRAVFGGRTIAGVYNYFAAKMQQPGITGVTNYTTDSYTGAMTGRIMDNAGSLGLAQAFTGAAPTGPGTNYDYPTTFNQQQDSAVMNNTQLPSTSNVTPTPSPSPSSSTGSSGGSGSQVNVAAFPPAGIIIAQPASVLRGFPVIVSWATVGTQTCGIYMDNSLIAEGSSGTNEVSSNGVAVTGGTLNLWMSCQTYSGAALEGSSSVLVRPNTIDAQNTTAPQTTQTIEYTGQQYLE